MPYTYDYPRPSVTVDCVIFGLDEGELKVLLIERDQPPFKGRWALPGGFVEMEETGLSDVYLEQLYTFGDVGRDPRGRVISVAFYALLKLCGRPLAASSDARRAAWFGLSDLPSLAFDHDRILAAALERLKGKVRYQPIGFELLPSKFTLTQLQRVYETVLERELDKRNFRKKILSMGIVIELDEIQQDVAHRAARLYRFDDQRYRRLRKKGFNFEI
jgi:8-oxo-dGTP diphosphatase